MKMVLLQGLVVAFLLSFHLPAQTNPASIGSTIEDFQLPDVKDGKRKSLRDLAGEKGTAIIFVATGCPYSNAFNHVMAEFASEYESRGISVIGINANLPETAAQVAEHAEKHGLHFPVLKDEGNRIADRLGAVVTPEVFFVDEEFVLRYHGALGNSRQPTTNPDAANADEVSQAVEAVLSGQGVPVTTTKMFGCTIKR